VHGPLTVGTGSKLPVDSESEFSQYALITRLLLTGHDVLALEPWKFFFHILGLVRLFFVVAWSQRHVHGYYSTIPTYGFLAYKRGLKSLPTCINYCLPGTTNTHSNHLLGLWFRSNVQA
jgi:hypothetical protein